MLVQQELHEQRTSPTGRRVDQRPFPTRPVVNVMGHHMSRHPLQQDSRRRPRRDLVGDRHHHLLRHCGELGIDADHRSGIGNPVAFGYPVDAGAHANHVPSGFNAWNERQLHRVRRAGTVLGVHEVDPDGLVAHQDHAQSWGGSGNLDRAEHLRAAVHVDPHREHPPSS